MKSFLLGITLLVSTVGTILQENSFEQRAIVIARETTDKLRLSEYTYIKLKQVIEIKLKEIDAAAKTYENDTIMYQETVKEIEKQYESELIAHIPKGTIPLYLKFKSSLSLTNDAMISKK